jgi:hypothetical protein
MYKSKSEIEKKLGQVKFVYKEISRFKNRIFVNNGLDEETESYPLLTHISSFIAHSRSILQYAQKEAKESGKQSNYDNYVCQNKVIKFFKMIRDSEIHEYTIGSSTTMTIYSPIVSYDSETQNAIGKKVELNIEPLSSLNSTKNKEIEMTITLTKKIKTDDAFIQKLEVEGNKDLFEAARNGKELFEEQECDGEKDIFKLCEKYIKELELFIEFGKTDGFIT